MKKNISMILLILFACTLIFGACDDAQILEEDTKLAQVTNIAYENGILSYDAVDGATAYQVTFTHNGETVYQDKIADTAIDIESLGIKGNISFSVYACNDKSKGPEATFEFAALTAFDSVVFEAEDNLYNFGTGKEQSNFRNNVLAHKGAYVGGIDDAGQGIFINYLCPFEGTFTLTAYYLRDSEAAHHDVWVNGVCQAQFVYTENTGWGGATFNPSSTSVEITLKKGWNTISIMKNGDASDNWGAFAELDYLVLEGNGETYNADDLTEYGTCPAYYRLEAEMGSPRKKDTQSGLYVCKNPCIVQTAENTYSNGFLMGGIENNYDGVEWHFNSPVKAKYKITIAYASGSFEGSQKARPSFVVTQTEIKPNRNADFADYQIVTMDELEYTGWNNVTVATQTVEIVLEKGKNFIYCIKLDNSGFFQIDYCDLAFVCEISEDIAE